MRTPRTSASRYHLSAAALEYEIERLTAKTTALEEENKQLLAALRYYQETVRQLMKEREDGGVLAA